MSDFDALKVYDGVGDYHMNRYRIAFQTPTGGAQQLLAADFVSNFPRYLESPYASVQITSREFNGKDTLKFWGSMKLLGMEANSATHHDWVVREWMDPTVGFTAQTLKRHFNEMPDDFNVGVSPAGAFGIWENKYHFLAGRRSWRIGPAEIFKVNPLEYDPAGDANAIKDLLILETAAVERFSGYAIAVGNWGLDWVTKSLEDRIPPVWIANLENFVKLKGLSPKTPRGVSRTGWENARSSFPTIGAGNVSFYRESFGDLGALKSDYEFTEIIRLFPTILP
jgi:hypothetical protein